MLALVDGEPRGVEVGGYRIEERLGEGGMGEVFRAVRLSDGQEVALKLLKTGLQGDARQQRRFEREARAAREITHRHLVEVLDAGEYAGRSYLVMRYVPGRSLEELLAARGPLPVPDVTRLMLDVASGLDALHGAGLVHRDIKPSNILLEADGSASLADFGLAKRRDYSALTQPGQMMGTLNYVAPELWRGEEPGPPADLYALGCVVFQCLAGRTPFAGRSLFEIGLAHLDESPPDPCADRSDGTAALSEFALQALAKDPADRPPNATAYARLLLVAARPG